MSDKRRFMQNTVPLLVACHYGKPDVDIAIRWGEAMWEKLHARGYGSATKAHKPRDLKKDYYKELSEFQKKVFCHFWEVFKYKKGRAEAAMVWYQMGELTQTEYDQIIAAAKREAAREVPRGMSRKMAQGWLSEKRYLDDAPAPLEDTRKKADARKAKIAAIAGDLQHANQMLQLDPESDHWKAEKAKLETALDELRGAKHED